MRIGFDARLPFYQMGGISQYILHLLPALAEVDAENRYWVFQNGRDRRYLAPRAANFRRRRLWTPCHHPWEQLTLGVELLPHQLDLLHSPDFIPPQFGARRRVITVHDLNFIYYPQFLTKESSRYYAEQIEWAVQAADHISADSHATRYDLIEKLHVPPHKVTTVHLAANPIYKIVHPPEAVAATLAKYKLAPGYILFVGTLEPRKNLPFLLQAYKQLRAESDIDVPLVLVGSKGWLYEEVFNTIDGLGLRPCVIHLEGIYDETLAHIYLRRRRFGHSFTLRRIRLAGTGGDALRLPGDRQQPRVAAGGGRRGGIKLDLQDEGEWADALHRVLTDSALRENMIAAGSAQAKTFSWRKTAEQTRAIYEKL
jgi:glycosyltransferase involved in cell wall biosynthesis